MTFLSLLLQVLQNCDSLPKYVAVASFIGDIYPQDDGKAGVMISCNSTELTVCEYKLWFDVGGCDDVSNSKQLYDFISNLLTKYIYIYMKRVHPSIF